MNIKKYFQIVILPVLFGNLPGHFDHHDNQMSDKQLFFCIFLKDIMFAVIHVNWLST